MTTKTCKVCTKPATLHTEGNTPFFFCDQVCASRIGQPCELRSKSVHHDVIDNNHPLYGFVKHNAWLVECIGEMRADGSVIVTNKAAVQPLINYLLIGPRKRSSDEPEEDRDPSAFEKYEDTDETKALFEKLANLKLDQVKADQRTTATEKRQTDEQLEEKRKRTEQDLKITYDNIWQVPIDVVSEILLALVDYAMKEMSPDMIRAMYEFAQNRSKFIEYLSKLPEQTRKNMAFSVIQRVPSPEVQRFAYLLEKRELLVFGALLQLERVHVGSSSSFWNMQEEGSLNTLMHYAVGNNYGMLARAMYVRGALATIKNCKGTSANDLINTFGRDSDLFNFP